MPLTSSNGDGQIWRDRRLCVESTGHMLAVGKGSGERQIENNAHTWGVAMTWGGESSRVKGNKSGVVLQDPNWGAPGWRSLRTAQGMIQVF